MPDTAEVKQLRKELTYLFETQFKPFNKGLGELSQQLHVSKSYVSLFLSGKLMDTSTKFIRRIRSFIGTRSINAHDQRLLVQLLALLDKAHDDRALLAALIDARGGAG